MSDSARPVGRSALVVAGVVAAVQGAALIAFALLDLSNLSGERISLGVGVVVLLLVFGVGLLAAALAVTRGRSLGRGPVLVAQFIALGLAVNLWGAPEQVSRVVPGLLIVGAVVVLGCLFSGAGRRAMNPGDEAG